MNRPSYQYQSFGNTYVISVMNHQEMMAALTDFCKERKIVAGEITGLGATDSAVLRVYNPITKAYVDHEFNEQMEISNITGNISTMNGEVYLHVHITLGRHDCSTISGHLLTTRISGACEVIIRDFGAPAIDRYKDDETGLNLFDFRK